MCKVTYYNADGDEIPGSIPSTMSDGSVRVFSPNISDGGELAKRKYNHMFGFATTSYALQHGGGKGKMHSASASGLDPWQLSPDTPIGEQVRRECLCGCGRFTQPTDDGTTWKLFIDGHETRDFFPEGN